MSTRQANEHVMDKVQAQVAPLAGWWEAHEMMEPIAYWAGKGTAHRMRGQNGIASRQVNIQHLTQRNEQCAAHEVGEQTSPGQAGEQHMLCLSMICI